MGQSGFPSNKRTSQLEVTKPKGLWIGSGDSIYYLFWATWCSFWIRCTGFVLSVKTQISSSFSCAIRTSPERNGSLGAVLGKLVCVTLSISSYTPFIPFQFLLSHQVPEGLCFPIIFLDMGEVLGTNILFQSVTTVKLVHYWVFRAIVSFVVSLFGIDLLFLYHRGWNWSFERIRNLSR